MLPAIRRWRSERSASAWPWKSSVLVRLFSMAACPFGPRRRSVPRHGRCERIVGSASWNIRGNSGRFVGHFSASPGAHRSYSGGVNKAPALVAFVACVTALSAALAAEPSPLERQALAFVQAQLGGNGALPGRVEVVAGPLDAR